MKNKLFGFNSGKLFLLLCISLCLMLNMAIFAAPGDLDLSFGMGGKGFYTFAGVGTARGSSVQPDGKIVLASEVIGADATPDFAVIRLNSNGTVDTSFGTNGLAAISFDSFSRESAIDVVVQTDGKIVVVGYVEFGSPSWDFAAARLNSDGSLDTSFGNGGKVKIPVSNSRDFASDAILQPDGKILIVGKGYDQPNSDIALVRLNPNGTFDTTFNGTGKLIVQLQNANSLNEELNSVALQPDGKIVAAGCAEGFLAIRLNSNGTFDNSFGTSGVVKTSVGTQYNCANGITVQPDGKVVAVGLSNSGSSNQAGIIRLNANGSIDTAFGSEGKVILENALFQTQTFRSVFAQNDGKITAVGTSSFSEGSSFLLVGFNPDGSFNNSFGNGGKVTVKAAPTSSDVNSALLQPDGKLVVVGGGSNNQTYGIAAARFLLDSSAQRKTNFDFDGDGKSDISVFRPPSGAWYISNSSNGAFSGLTFGAATDLTAPADYDGDGKTDIAVFRSSNGTWYLQQSTDGFKGVTFGQSGDLPVPADYDGDGKADIAVYRPSTGSWYRLNSSNSQFVGVQFGAAEDKPTLGDFDGDGKSDIAVFRPSNGAWYRLNSSNGSFFGVQFGFGTDKPVSADYDGDGKTDIAVYRASNGGWYRLNSSDNSFAAVVFGVSQDKPVPADYDGDGKTDVAVFRPSNGTWYLLQTTSGFAGQQFGVSEDIPTPNAFIR